MHAKPDNPFQAHPDWHYNACVNNFAQYWRLGDYYVRAADALIEDALNDTSLLDVYVLPVCFLYRHAVELLLKHLLWQSHYLAHAKKKLKMKTHKLSGLWQELSANAQAVLGPAFPLSGQDKIVLDQFLCGIEEHDSGSYAFRYPFDLKGKRSHPTLIHVNFRSLYESVHQAVDLLVNLGEVVESAYLAKSHKTTEPAAAPNAGPATRLGNSGAAEGPPSVS
jgi:hypothetical protein